MKTTPPTKLKTSKPRLHLNKVVKSLRAKGLLVAVAESCSGGLLADQLTNVPGSSDFFLGGVVAYNNSVKTRILNVPTKLLNDWGAVSFPVAEAMAKNVRSLFKSKIGIGVTGIAGPSGGSALKPVGLTYIAVNIKNKTICQEFRFQGSRLDIKNQAVEEALRMLNASIK